MTPILGWGGQLMASVDKCHVNGVDEKGSHPWRGQDCFSCFKTVKGSREARSRDATETLGHGQPLITSTEHAACTFYLLFPGCVRPNTGTRYLTSQWETKTGL